MRPFRYWGVIGSLWFRVMATPIPVIALVFDYGAKRSAPVILMALVLLSVYVAVALSLTPNHLRDRVTVTSWLVIDTVVVVWANLGAAALVDRPLDDAYWAALWPLVQGTVSLWLALYGVRVALVVVSAGAPLFALMLILNPADRWRDGIDQIVAHTLWLLLALGVAYTVNTLLRSRAVLALAEGITEGTESERLRSLRLMHDTALQALEAIALLSSTPHQDPATQQRLIADTARTEAEHLRAILDGEGDAHRSVAHDISELVAAERRRGVPVRLTQAVDDSCPVPSHLQDACRDALRETLTNARQHSHAEHVLVRVYARRGLLQIEVVDDGVGFDPTSRVRGFGIAQSMRARLDAVGADLDLQSQPGLGTTVRMTARWDADVLSMSGIR